MATIERSLRFATLNVRGLTLKKKQSQLYRLALDNDLDLIAIQETKIEGECQTAAMVQRFTACFDIYVSRAVGMSAGCALLIRRSLGISVQNVITCLSGRFVVCNFTFSFMNWRAICIYAPNHTEERRDFFEAIKQHCNCERTLILLGDFNCVCSAKDKTSATPFADVSTNVLTDMINEYGLDDVGEWLSTGRCSQYTHYQGTSHARLDRAYVSLELLPLCCNYQVAPVSFSDHCLVMFDMGCKKAKKNFSWDTWKLNNKLLEDDVLISKTTDAIKQLGTIKATDIVAEWELFKQKFKMAAIERGSIIKHEQTKDERLLRENLCTLIKEESAAPGAFKDDICAVKRKLEHINTERYRGALVRARAEHMLHLESPSKRAIAMEKRHSTRNEIEEIEFNGRITKEKTEIEQVFYEHYCRLFSYNAVDINNFKREFLPLMPRLDDATKDVLELPISEDEVRSAIDKLNLGKSPGPDGISASFYKIFKNGLACPLTVLFNEAYNQGALPPSFKSSHTILIPKTDDKDKLRQVISYRPICLANVDYKILMKVLASRLQTVIKELVGPHQTCGIKGRTILTNIHTARSVLECCDAMQSQVAMLQIDLEKAFDKVPHDVLMAVLEHVNVGSVILEGVRMAYNNCTTRIIVNKSVGNRIQVQKSVRQGCPLSSLLFAIYIECFCLSILNSTGITGFKLNSNEVRVLAYADDIAVFATNLESICETVKIVKRFCLLSGSAVNWEKCQGLWHGQWDLTPSKLLNIKWTSTPVKYLGVPLQYYTDTDPYWRIQSAELRSQVGRWKGWDLSVFGRATACNIFLVSKLWYVLQVLHCSRLNIQKLHRVFAVFIWGSSWERTSRTNLFRSVRNGGLGLAHLFVKQLIGRFLFLRDIQDPFLRSVCQLRLCKALPEYIISSAHLPGTPRGYYKEVVLSYQFLVTRFSLDYLSSVSRKKLYKDVVSAIFAVPVYRSLFSSGPGQDVLKRVKRMIVPPGVKTFFFQLHTGTVLVKTWMAEKGLFVPWGTDCSLCKKPETIEHVFIECWDAVFFWDILQRTLKKDLPINARGIRFLPVENDDGVPFDTLMLLGLHGIWRSRLAVRHNDVDARPVRQYFHEDVLTFLEVHKAQPCVPEWVPRVEAVLHMKPF